MTPQDVAAILSENSGGVVIPCWIQPRASRNKIVGIHDGALKISLTAPPVDGKANAELCKFMAKKLSVPKSAVMIVAGDSSRRKKLAVPCASPAEVAVNLAK